MNAMQLGWLQQAMNHYTGRGYKYLDVPWIVGHESIHVTLPPGAKAMEVPGIGYLVGSGEQSFIHMWLRGELSPGKYCCCTPCFRDEPVLNELYRQCFMKLELIEVFPHDVDAWDRDLAEMSIFKDAFDFHRNYLPVEMVRTDIGHDLFHDGVELGSYGYRQYDNMKWVYGTGCAMPRFEICINRAAQKLLNKEAAEWEAKQLTTL